MARKVDEEAYFISVQLIEQEPGIHDKCHVDYARQNKMHLTWEIISHEIKETGFWLNHGRTDAPKSYLVLILYISILLY
jgi:hypothetical protein